MNLNSLCGKNEKINTKRIAGITMPRTRDSKYTPNGNRIIESPMARGIAE